MSYKKGYTYENVKEFCEKYGCKLLDSKDEIDLKPAKINIESSCGHESVTTFNRLMMDKFGVYCVECFKTMDEVKCFDCGKMFEPTNNSFVFCSAQCTRTRKVSDEQKHKECIDNTILDDELIRQLRLKNKNEKSKKQRRDAGIKEQKIYTYKLIKEEYEKEGCELLTTEDEFNVNKSCRKFKIRGKCGCIIECSDFRNFKYYKNNISCNTCTNNNTSIIMKDKSKIDGITTTMLIEKTGVDLIKEISEDIFTIIKTREGCEADILVRPIDVDNDIWLPIQLKITDKKCERYGSVRYSFNLHRNYNDMLLLLVCVQDNKFWMFESNDDNVKSLQKISIGINRSVYDYACVDNLVDMFNYWYNKNIYNITFEKGNTPQSKNAQLEYEYVKLREDTIKFINFTSNTMDGLVYDFKINDLKIQEKVCTPKRNSYFVSIKKNGGFRDGEKRKQMHIPYHSGDNNFYWFNLQDRNTFYVVPEIELINRGFITTSDSKGKKYLQFSTNNYWLNSYKFYYGTINEECNKGKLMLIFDLI